MKAPVAQAPDATLANVNVYIFANGVKGGGPLGFQPEVNAPTRGRTLAGER